MAFTRVQGNAFHDSTSAASVGVTISAVTSGNTICGFVAWDTSGGATLTSVTDDKGNTYNLETSQNDATNAESMAAFSRTNITNGPITITANLSISAAGRKIIVDEFSGGSTASTDERDGTAHGGQFQSSPGTGTDGITSGTFTTSTNGDLIYGCCIEGGGSTTFATNGTNFSTGTQNNTLFAGQSEFRTQTTAGSGTAGTFTQAANVSRIVFMVSIKPAAGGGATLNTAWFRPSEDRLPRKFLADTCAAIALAPPPAPVGITGMAWFEPPDRDKVPVKIKVESPPALALTPATLPPTVSGMAWFAPPDRDKPATKVLFDQVPASMGTSFPRVFGMGWFAPPDKDKLATKVRVESPPALALTNIAFVSGIGWYNPPDRDKLATKVTVEAPPAIALTPATLPPKIAGMAWFEPLDSYPPRAFGKSEPHSFSFGPMTAPTPISGMAWFEPPDRNRPVTKVSVEATPAWNPQVITAAAVTAPPTGWWTNTPDNINRCVRRTDDPSLIPFAPAQPILWWSPEDCKPRAPRQLSDVPAFSLTDTSQIPGMGWLVRPDELRRVRQLIDQLSQVFTPIPLLNVAWFIIPDRDGRILKQSVEAIPSLCLTPSTLPPQIAGMAWFQPWERAVIGRGVSANTTLAWNPQVIIQAAPPPPPSGDQYRVSGQEVRDLFLHDGVSYPSAITRKTNL